MGSKPSWQNNSFKKTSGGNSAPGHKSVASLFHGKNMEADEDPIYLANGGPVRRYADGGYIGNSASDRDWEESLKSVNPTAAEAKGSLSRLLEGNIDDPSSVAHAKYRMPDETKDEVSMLAERHPAPDRGPDQSDAETKRLTRDTPRMRDNDEDYVAPKPEPASASQIRKTEPVERVSMPRDEDEARKTAPSRTKYKADSGEDKELTRIMSRTRAKPTVESDDDDGLLSRMSRGIEARDKWIAESRGKKYVPPEPGLFSRIRKGNEQRRKWLKDREKSSVKK